MPEIKVKHVVSFSSEDPKFPAANLLKHEGTAKWRCAGAGEKSMSAVLQFEKACQINQIDIGNDGAAFIEVLVGRSSQTEDEYQVILVASSFMSPQESRGGQNLSRVRMFTEDKLSKAVIAEKWDRIKVVCTQPFNKTSPFGVCFINFHSPPDGSEEKVAPQKQMTMGAFKIKSEDSLAGDLKPGTLFSQAKEKKPEVPLTGAAAVRAASKAAESMQPSSSYTSPKTESRTPSEHRPEVSRTPSQEHRHAGEPSSLKRKYSDDRRPRTPDSLKAGKAPSRDHGSASSQETPPLKKHSSAAESTSKYHTPPLKKARSEPSSGKKERDLHSLMKKVTFVMSGFQNPYRGELRDKAKEMGATYKPDWGKGCTHLICAFANTPKYQAVKGEGRIVTKDWILDCHKQRRAIPWRKYRLGNAPSPAASSAEESEEEEEVPRKKIEKPATKPSPKKAGSGATSQDVYGGSTDESGGDTDDEIERVKRQNETNKKTAASDPYDVPTDPESDGEEEAMVTNGNGVADAESDGELPPLPDFFTRSTFFLYGKFDADARRRLNRYIVAYNGKCDEYMSEKVTHVLTNSGWDEHFDEALAENPQINFVKPAWVISCHDKQKLLPYQRFMVVPA